MHVTEVYIGNDHVVTLEGLVDQDGDAVTGASVEMRVLDYGGNLVDGVSWPVTLLHRGQGTYSATLPDEAKLEGVTGPEIEIVATAGGATATWQIPIQPVDRTA